MVVIFLNSLISQISDPTTSVEKIGFWATVGIIFTLLIVWAVKQLFNYFTTRLDKKDEQILKQQDEYLRLVDDRRRDLERVEKLLDTQTVVLKETSREHTQGLHSVLEGLQALANELKKRKR